MMMMIKTDNTYKKKLCFALLCFVIRKTMFLFLLFTSTEITFECEEYRKTIKQKH